MHWRIQLLIGLLLVGVVMMGYLRFNRNRINQNAPAAHIEVMPSPINSTATTDQPVKITNFAKVMAVPFDVKDTASQSAILEFIGENKPGMVVLFGDNITFDEAAEAVNEIRNQVYEDDFPLIAVDHEGGSVQRLSGTGFSELPSWKRVCAQSAEIRQAELASSAAELSQVGIDVVLAPVVDVAESNYVLKDRACDGDVNVITAAADDYVNSFLAEGIIPVLKHYPGIGSVNVDLHQRFADVAITSVDAEPFKLILDKHPSIGVMTTHVGVTNQISGLPCSESYVCVNQIFELYPKSLVMADAIDMKAALYNKDNEKLPKDVASAAIDAILAGNQLVLFGPDVSVNELNEVLNAINSEYTGSEEFRIRVNRAVERIAEAKPLKSELDNQQKN